MPISDADRKRFDRAFDARMRDPETRRLLALYFLLHEKTMADLRPLLQVMFAAGMNYGIRNILERMEPQDDTHRTQ